MFFFRRYPVVRLAVAASPLQLHLSPYRYQQLMTVLQSALASPEGAAATEATSSSTGAAGDKPLWLSEAEYTAKVRGATWFKPSAARAYVQAHSRSCRSLMLLCLFKWRQLVQHILGQNMECNGWCCWSS